MIDGYDEAKHPDVALGVPQRAIDAGIRILVSSRSAVPDRLASIGTSLTLADLANPLGEDLLRNAGVEEHVLGQAATAIRRQPSHALNDRAGAVRRNCHC